MNRGIHNEVIQIDQLCDETLGDKEGMFYFVREVKRGDRRLGSERKLDRNCSIIAIMQGT